MSRYHFIPPPALESSPGLFDSFTMANFGVESGLDPILWDKLQKLKEDGCINDPASTVNEILMDGIAALMRDSDK